MNSRAIFCVSSSPGRRNYPSSVLWKIIMAELMEESIRSTIQRSNIIWALGRSL